MCFEVQLLNSVPRLVSIDLSYYAVGRVFELGKGPVPSYPSLGLQIIRIEQGEVIDVVVQNNPGNSFNGDYRPNGASRNSTEQHPFQ